MGGGILCNTLFDRSHHQTLAEKKDFLELWRQPQKHWKQSENFLLILPIFETLDDQRQSKVNNVSNKPIETQYSRIFTH